MDTGWVLREDAFDARHALAWEGLLTQGSGYLHVRASLEEHLRDAPQNQSFMRLPGNVTVEQFGPAKAKWGTYVPGIFGRHPLFFNEMINLPWFCGLSLFIEGEALDMEQSAIRDYRRTLHLRTGKLTRSLTWHTRAGHVLYVTFSRFISMARPHLCCQRVTVRSDRACTLEVAGGIDADVRTSGHDHLAACQLRPAGDGGVECVLTTDNNDKVSIVSELTGPAATWDTSSGHRRMERRGTVHLEAAGTVSVEKRTAVSTSRDIETCSADQTLGRARASSHEKLFEEHARCWNERWKMCDVVVDGDTEAQLALRVSLYHLLRCHVPGDARVTVDAKGYAGDAYFGHFFWDTEMYLLPFYLYTDPDRAKTLVDFRLQSLGGARRNAAEYGYRGARFAWESDSEGNECTAKGNWQYRDHEIHVTADVVYGIDHYARATGNHAYLREDACELLVETARYWLDRMDKRPGDSFPSILGVMGPDEYTPFSNNNSYTNRLVSHCLDLAAQHGRYGGASEQECEAFAEAAKSLPQPRSADGNLVLQCEGFHRLAAPCFEQLWTDRSRPFAAIVSQERLYRSQCMKQADVLMLMHLFPADFTKAQMRAAWDYYVPLCTHDSSLSAGVHALMALRLGLADEAWGYWREASGIDLDPTTGGAAQGVHIANAAAAWMVAIMGFGGMASAMETDIPTFTPSLPPHWKSLSFPLCWKGHRMRVRLSHEAVTFHNRSDQAGEVCLYRERLELPPNGVVTVQL